MHHFPISLLPSTCPVSNNLKSKLKPLRIMLIFFALFIKTVTIGLQVFIQIHSQSINKMLQDWKKKWDLSLGFNTSFLTDNNILFCDRQNPTKMLTTNPTTPYWILLLIVATCFWQWRCLLLMTFRVKGRWYCNQGQTRKKKLLYQNERINKFNSWNNLI